MDNQFAILSADIVYFADRYLRFLLFFFLCLFLYFFWGLNRVHTPTPRVKIANQASIKITPVIAVTTEPVVLRLRLSVLGLMRNPKWQATSVTIKPNNNPLIKLNVRLTGWTT